MSTNFRPSELQVGQRVALGRYGTWGNVSNQGVYVVAKANKVRVVLKRERDGYERIWSVKRNLEVKNYGSGEKYEDRDTFITSLEYMAAKEAERQHAAMVNGLWRNLEGAAQGKNLDLVRQLVAQLEAEVK